MAATVDGQAAQVAQNAAQVAEDKVTVEKYMQTADDQKKQALEAAERLNDSVDLVQKNTVDLLGKAPVIIGSATSYGTPVEVNDSAEMPLQGLRLYGKSWQETTTGKNLLDADDYYSAYKQADGTYKAKTVILNDIRISLSEFVGKKITLSVKLTVGTNATAAYISYIGSEQNHINGSLVTSGSTGKSTLTVTPVSNTDYFTI